MTSHVAQKGHDSIIALPFLPYNSQNAEAADSTTSDGSEETPSIHRTSIHRSFTGPPILPMSRARA